MPLSLLQLLRTHRGNWLTVESVGVALSLEPPEIAHKLDQLRRMGYKIENVPAYGFRLSAATAGLTAELIEYDLDTRRIGRKVLVYESTDSTNEVVWNYSRGADYDGLAVFAEHQRLGRGRFHRRWSSPPGSSILCSVLLQNFSRDVGLQLTLMAGLAVAEAVEEVCSVRGRIKWPNDVIVSGGKLAGIMVESRGTKNICDYVIGIGINCRQSRDDFDPSIRESAVSIRQLTNTDVDRVQLAQRLLVRLDRWLTAIENKQIDKLHKKWLARCDEIGRRLTLISNGSEYVGRVIDVSPDQGLILQLESGPIKVFDPATTSVAQ